LVGEEHDVAQDRPDSHSGANERPATAEEWERREEIMAAEFAKHAERWERAIPVEEVLARLRKRMDAAS
jgi:hypothetical protein